MNNKAEIQDTSWIKLHRKFINWKWFSKPEMMQLFIYILLKANHDTREWLDIHILRGQFVTSVAQLSANTGLSTSTIRRCLNRLKSTNEITIETTSRYSIITVCKYDIYQGRNINMGKDNDKRIDKQKTNQGQTKDNKQETKEHINDKEYIKSMKEISVYENSQLINLIIEEFKFRFQEYHKTEYLITNMSKEVNAAKGIIKLYRSQSNESSTDSIVEDLSSIFKACVCINNRWLRDNMSLSLILSRFNQINITLKNGKDRQNSTNGATDAELAEIISQIRPAKE